MIQQLANVRRIKPVSGRLPSVLGKYAIQKVLTYPIITVLFTALCVSVFNTLELKAEFAMAVVGSLIGGFLGAMLAAVLMLRHAVAHRQGRRPTQRVTTRGRNPASSVGTP